MNFLICYDISKNKIRRKASKILESYGIRTQYSIFELEVNEFEYNKIREDLLKIIDYDTDRLYFFNLCENCMKKIEKAGNIESFIIDPTKNDIIII